MIDSVLSGKSLRARLTLKALLSLAVLALSVALPQLVHLCFGAGMGVALLPMYLPVLLGAGFLGVRWGVTVGVLSPLVSFALTSLFSSPMPALSRLPSWWPSWRSLRSSAVSLQKKLKRICSGPSPLFLRRRFADAAVFSCSRCFSAALLPCRPRWCFRR